MQNDRKLAGEMTKCDGRDLEEEVGSYGSGLDRDRERGRRDRPLCRPSFNEPELLWDVLKKNRNMQLLWRDRRSGAFVGLCDIREGKEGNRYVTIRRSHGRQGR